MKINLENLMRFSQGRFFKKTVQLFIMNWNIIFNNPIADSLFQISLAALATILIFPHIKNKIKVAFILAIITDIIVDGSHVINKSITHNLLFLIDIPLVMLLFGYTFRLDKISRLSILIFGNFFTYFIADAAIEHDTLQILYPFSNQHFVWNNTIVIFGEKGAFLGIFLWLLTIFTLNIVEKMMWRTHINQLQVPPPSPTGKRFSKLSFHPSLQ